MTAPSAQDWRETSCDLQIAAISGWIRSLIASEEACGTRVTALEARFGLMDCYILILGCSLCCCLRISSWGFTRHEPGTCLRLRVLLQLLARVRDAGWKGLTQVRCPSLRGLARAASIDTHYLSLVSIYKYNIESMAIRVIIEKLSPQCGPFIRLHDVRKPLKVHR